MGEMLAVSLQYAQNKTRILSLESGPEVAEFWAENSTKCNVTPEL